MPTNGFSIKPLEKLVTLAGLRRLRHQGQRGLSVLASGGLILPGDHRFAPRAARGQAIRALATLQQPLGGGEGDTLRTWNAQGSLKDLHLARLKHVALSTPK